MDVEEKGTPVHHLQRVLPPSPHQRNVNVNVTQRLLLRDESGAYDQVQRRQRMTTATLKGEPRASGTSKRMPSARRKGSHLHGAACGETLNPGSAHIPTATMNAQNRPQTLSFP